MTEIRGLGGADEIGPFLIACEAAFGHETRPDDIERFKTLVDPARMYVAVEDQSFVATAGSYSFDMTVPGGEVTTAGVTMVGVLPSHRRRGLLNALMRRQLDDLHSAGEPVALLWASEGNIYQRYGYGMASLHGGIRVARDRAVFRKPWSDTRPQGRARLLSHKEALKALPDVYERVRVETPGLLTRSDAWWDNHLLADPEHNRDGGGPLFRALLEIDGRAEAYALYRVHSRWEDGTPSGKLQVGEAMATTPRATFELWSFLFGVDLIATIEAYQLPADHPLIFMLAEPRRARWRLSDGLWVRLVDVGPALEARGYRVDDAIVFELGDDFCPWNTGRWRLEAVGGAARLERTDDPADLALDAGDLGALYLGGIPAMALAGAGRVIELIPGAARRADALFAAERAPFCPEIW